MVGRRGREGRRDSYKGEEGERQGWEEGREGRGSWSKLCRGSEGTLRLLRSPCLQSVACGARGHRVRPPALPETEMRLWQAGERSLAGHRIPPHGGTWQSRSCSASVTPLPLSGHTTMLSGRVASRWLSNRSFLLPFFPAFVR